MIDRQSSAASCAGGRPARPRGVLVLGLPRGVLPPPPTCCCFGRRARLEARPLLAPLAVRAGCRLPYGLQPSRRPDGFVIIAAGPGPLSAAPCSSRSCRRYEETEWR